MNSKLILAVDDEQHISDVIEYVLEENGMKVAVASTGDKGLAMFRAKNPDLVILDLNLPGLSGLDLFKEMKKLKPNVPVIMLTSRGEEIDRVVGLELGADDYVTKPFSPRELAARVKAVLRRSEATPEKATETSFGPLRLDSNSFSAIYFGKHIQLTRQEFKLIECLIKNPARVYTRDMLMGLIYDDEHFVTDRSIDACVKRIRKKFEEIRKNVEPLETVHGIGYKLNQQLEGMK